MAAGVVLLVLAVGLFLFIVVEGGNSRGCLICLVIPLGLGVAGGYLIVTDPFGAKPDGAVLGTYRGLSLRDGQGWVIPTEGRPYRVEGTTGTTVALGVVSRREMLRASLLARAGAPTYRACARALESAGTAGNAPLTAVRPGQAWCTRDYGEYADDRSVRMIRVTAVHPARVTFDVTVWKAG